MYLVASDISFVNFQFVASPKCQFVLNEIVYRGCRKWQDEGFVIKATWFLLQLILVTVTSIVYIPVRLIRKCYCCNQLNDKSCWKFRKFYEHPYSKFINQTMSYVVFLCLVFASSYQDEFSTDRKGPAMVPIGKICCLY